MVLVDMNLYKSSNMSSKGCAFSCCKLECVLYLQRNLWYKSSLLKGFPLTLRLIFWISENDALWFPCERQAIQITPWKGGRESWFPEFQQMSYLIGCKINQRYSQLVCLVSAVQTLSNMCIHLLFSDEGLGDVRIKLPQRCKAICILHGVFGVLIKKTQADSWECN